MFDLYKEHFLLWSTLLGAIQLRLPCEGFAVVSLHRVPVSLYTEDDDNNSLNVYFEVKVDDERVTFSFCRARILRHLPVALVKLNHHLTRCVPKNLPRRASRAPGAVS